MPSYNQTQEADLNTTAPPASPSEVPLGPANASVSTGNGTTIEYNNPAFTYCLLEAQSWVGVDVDAPDCIANPNNTLCADPESASRLVGLTFALRTSRSSTINHSIGQSIQ